MNKICKEMNKLRPILKFLWYYDDNDADADETQGTTITRLFFEQLS